MEHCAEDNKSGRAPLRAVATPAQVEAAIRGLTQSDHKKLFVIARYYWKNRRLRPAWAEPEDLLQEAIMRTLGGPRDWRVGVSIVRHLDGVMKSISSHIVEAGVNQRTAVEKIHVVNGGELPTGDPRAPPNRKSGVDEQIIARAELQRIESMFADHPSALQIVSGRAQHMTEAEIRSVTGMSKRKYDAAKKHVQRKLVLFALETGELQ